MSSSLIRKGLALSAASIFAVSLSSSVLAKTPDASTPSQETVCDVLDGKAWGLCNAYCEAIDCDDPNVHASNRACERIATNFERLTGGVFQLPNPFDLESCNVLVPQ